jgi:rhamnogalacturonyl hydrolase YesR
VPLRSPVAAVVHPTDHHLDVWQIAVISESPEKGESWDFTLDIVETSGQSQLRFDNPFFANNTCTDISLQWVYAGGFEKTSDDALLKFDSEQLVGENDEKTWWRLDIPDCWVRLYNENPLFGHWNYPLGVTLYGLIETARYFDKTGIPNTIAHYVKNHIAKSIRTIDYALFDKANFGGATAVHHLLTSIDSLDDCGSFGSTMLEVARDNDIDDIGDFQEAAEYVARHILKKQDRLECGAFYRKNQMHHFHNGTMWADDLYMSVPFLCRYARLKNDNSILDDAAVQFEGFKKHLFMENKNLMAHVYDFKRGMNTGVPWGRGNGWTIFSLSELLIVLPEEHKKRDFLLDFFRHLAAGFLATQGANGMWHQVLDMSESYAETSCTAMFIAAFSRGSQHHWFTGDTAPYRTAAEKGWRALEENAIDNGGNIYGVCRGSEFAFTPRYYAEHLLPRCNDTHGIGIVLLAGVELLKLQKYYSENIK